MSAFTGAASVKLTSTTSTQATALPAGNPSIVCYNGGANVVWLKYGDTVAAPTGGTWTAGLMCLQPGTTQVFGAPQSGGNLAYIAETAGGLLTVSVGGGE